MTSRRSFLKSLAGIVASVALAQRAVMESLKFETITNEALPPKTHAVNPAWDDAPYEVCVIYHPEAYKVMLATDVVDNPNEIWKAAAEAIKDTDDDDRFTFVGGEFKKVPKFLP